MAVSVDLEKSLDKAYEDKSLKDILDASPAALAGVVTPTPSTSPRRSTSRPCASSVPTSTSPWPPRSSRWRTQASFLREQTQNCPFSSEKGQFCVWSPVVHVDGALRSHIPPDPRSDGTLT